MRNAAKCRKCGDVIESKHRHDFRACSCGAIYVDGGKDYCRAGGNPEDFLPAGNEPETPRRVKTVQFVPYVFTRSTDLVREERYDIRRSTVVTTWLAHTDWGLVYYAEERAPGLPPPDDRRAVLAFERYVERRNVPGDLPTDD